MIKHFTATVYVLAKIDGEVKVLLHKHKKLGIWIGVGGHIESNENSVEAALREAKEETGLTITLLSTSLKGSTLTGLNPYSVKQIPTPEFLLEENIPPYHDHPSHYHLDCIYFGAAKNIKNLRMQEEFLWCSKNDLRGMKLQFEVAHIAPKAIEAGKAFFKG